MLIIIYTQIHHLIFPNAEKLLQQLAMMMMLLLGVMELAIGYVVYFVRHMSTGY